MNFCFQRRTFIISLHLPCPTDVDVEFLQNDASPAFLPGDAIKVTFKFGWEKSYFLGGAVFSFFFFRFSLFLPCSLFAMDGSFREMIGSCMKTPQT